MIEVIDFHKTYRDTAAVRGLSFSLPANSVLGLVGANGAGKTTTLKSLCGIIRPTSGRLIVAGHDIALEPIAAKAALAFIPDEPALFDALTVWEHLEFVASAYRVNDLAQRGETLLAEFDLTEKRDTVAGELSRGMRQKVAICCGYLHQPRCILFDEPLTGLDPRAIRTLKNSITARAQAGAAVIVSSHLLSLIEDLCTHLLILSNGQSLYFGPLSEARAHFADLGEQASLEEVFFRATE